jgi:hypothetical protein
MDMEMQLPSSVHADAVRSRFRDYLLALEEERRKIHVFQRELPLCLDLVTQSTYYPTYARPIFPFSLGSYWPPCIYCI